MLGVVSRFVEVMVQNLRSGVHGASLKIRKAVERGIPEQGNENTRGFAVDVVNHAVEIFLHALGEVIPLGAVIDQQPLQKEGKRFPTQTRKWLKSKIKSNNCVRFVH